MITERRLRHLFAAQGFDVVAIRNNRHWVVSVARNGGGAAFTVTVARSPGTNRFQHYFEANLRRAEREAMARIGVA
jgi:hypothetical protein